MGDLSDDCHCCSCIDDGEEPTIHWPEWVEATRYHTELLLMETTSDRWLASDHAGIRSHGGELQDELLALSEDTLAIDQVEATFFDLGERTRAIYNWFMR